MGRPARGGIGQPLVEPAGLGSVVAHHPGHDPGQHGVVAQRAQRTRRSPVRCRAPPAGPAASGCRHRSALAAAVLHAGHMLPEPALQRHGHQPGADQDLRRPGIGEPAHDIICLRIDQRPLVWPDFLITRLRGAETVVGRQEPLEPIENHQVEAAAQRGQCLICSWSGPPVGSAVIGRPEVRRAVPGGTWSLTPSPHKSSTTAAGKPADHGRRLILGPLPGQRALARPADRLHHHHRIGRPAPLIQHGQVLGPPGERCAPDVRRHRQKRWRRRPGLSRCFRLPSPRRTARQREAGPSAISRSSRNAPISASGLTSCRDFTWATNWASASASAPRSMSYGGQGKSGAADERQQRQLWPFRRPPVLKLRIRKLASRGRDAYLCPSSKTNTSLL